MGSLSQNEQRKLAYFHALSKTMTEGTQEVYETRYKSSHNVTLNEVWSDNIYFAADYMTAVAESLTNSAVTLFDQVVMNMIYGSNGQAYSYISGGTYKDDSYPLNERGQLTSGSTYIRPWVAPTDIPNSISNDPSNGYALRLFRGSDAIVNPNGEIYLTEGAFSVDYYAGVIHFAQGYTPVDMGWGSIKATFFQYSGNFGASGTTGGYTSAQFNSGTSQLVFNSGETTETILDLSSLNNVSGFTTAIFDNLTNHLIFNSGGTNQTIVDLSWLKDNSGFTSVEFNTGTNYLIFNSGGTNEQVVDLSVLKSVTGLTSLLSKLNIDMDVNTTTSGSTLACNSSILNPSILNSYVSVYVNGVQISVGDGVKTKDCYFSNDGGLTAKLSDDIIIGDLLYWSYVGDSPVSGFNLNSITDKMTFIYLTL
jgi:hypothetical protein